MAKTLQKSLFFILTLFFSSSALGEYILFNMAGSERKIKPITLPNLRDSASVTKRNDGSWKFSLKGSTGTKAKWFIPINIETSSQGKIHFNISSTNIRTVKGKANVYLVFKALQNHLNHNSQFLQGEEGEPTVDGLREIPIFTSSGSKDNALGWLPFNPSKNPISIEGFCVDLILSDNCSGELTLNALSITSDKNVYTKEDVDTVLSTSPPVQAELSVFNRDNPALSVNGNQHSLVGYSPGDYPDNSNYESFANANGVSIGRAIVNFGGINYFFRNQRPIWKDSDYIDFQYLDKTLRKACRNEKSYVILDVLLDGPPEWWLKTKRSFQIITPLKRIENDEISKFVSDSDDAMVQAFTKKRNSEEYLISDLDPSWREYCENALKQLFTYIRKRPYANRVIGCNVIMGQGMNDYPYPLRDRHPEYRKTFQEWLLARYLNINNLRNSWKNNTIEFQDIEPASQENWNKGDVFSFIHPLGGKYAADSHQFYHISWTNTLLHFCQLIKSLSHGHYLTGIIGGPGLAFNSLWNNSYHPTADAISLFLKSEFVDYIEIPVDSTDLRNGTGANGAELILSDSLRKHNKLLFIRNEIPFNVSYFQKRNIANDFEDVIQIQRRIFIASLVNNTPMYLFQTMPQGYRQSFAQKEIDQFQAIARKSLSLSQKKYSEIAFVIDFDVFRHISPGSDQSLVSQKNLKFSQHRSRDIRYLSPMASPYFYLMGIPRLVWNRIGAPYDIIDIEQFKPDQYKTIVFFHTLFLDDKRKKIIDSCKNDGRFIVSLWGNGFVTERYLTSLGHERVYGIGLQTLPNNIPLHLTLRQELERFMNRGMEATNIGWLYTFREPKHYIQKKFGPVFEVVDKKATILADYADGYGGGMAVRSFPDWTSFYSGSPIVNPEIMRELMRKSGIHLYLENNDLVYINDSFIGIHSLTDGLRQLNLPIATTLYEVFRDQELKKNKIHNIKLRGKKTYLFFRGDKKSWDSL